MISTREEPRYVPSVEEAIQIAADVESGRTRKLIRHGEPARVEVIVSTSRRVRDDLARLVETGFYGSSVEEAAEEMLRERLRQVLESEARMRHARDARAKKGRAT